VSYRPSQSLLAEMALLWGWEKGAWLMWVNSDSNLDDEEDLLN